MGNHSAYDGDGDPYRVHGPDRRAEPTMDERNTARFVVDQMTAADFAAFAAAPSVAAQQSVVADALARNHRRMTEVMSNHVLWRRVSYTMATALWLKARLRGYEARQYLKARAQR